MLEAADPVAAFRAVAAVGGRVVLPTSGTSGVARAVVRTARSWTDSFAPVAELTGLTAASTVWLPGPLTATMNLFAAVHADAIGARLVAAPADATHIHLTPARLLALLDEAIDLAGRTLVVAGDGLGPELRQRAERSGALVHHYYGAAELSYVAWGTDRTDLHPFPGVEVAVRDDEIWVRSPYLAEGYLEGRPGALRRTADGFATVGDRGRLHPTSFAPPPKVVTDDYSVRRVAVVSDHFSEKAGMGDGQGVGMGVARLEVSGRPDAIVTGGATVLVADVEAVLRPVVRGQLAVVGVPHPRLGQLVVGVLSDPADRDPARDAARGLGAGRPRRWYVRERLPLTGAGKLDRARLSADLTSDDLTGDDLTGEKPDDLTDRTPEAGDP